MRAYNYLDIDESSNTLVIEKDGYLYEYFEPNEEILISCENWTEMDINNYMHNNEPNEVVDDIAREAAFENFLES